MKDRYWKPLGAPLYVRIWLAVVATVVVLTLVFGWLWSDLAPLAAFAFGSICALSAALLLAFWVRPRPVV